MSSDAVASGGFFAKREIAVVCPVAVSDEFIRHLTSRAMRRLQCGEHDVEVYCGPSVGTSGAVGRRLLRSAVSRWRHHRFQRLDQPSNVFAGGLKRFNARYCQSIEL